MPQLKNPPIVEIVAELRWEPHADDLAARGAAPRGMTLLNPHSRFEEFFMGFGARAHSHGFTATERLVPPGFPFVQHQPVYRFRFPAGAEQAAMYQVGAGVFTANCVPPYKSWSMFSDYVEKGVRALIESRANSEQGAFTQVSLRYIDMFDDTHTGGVPAAEFVENVLGFTVTVPKVVEGLKAQDAVVTPALQLNVPLRSGSLMTIRLGEGSANNRTGVLLDSTVATASEVPSNVKDVMASLTQAHEALSELFVAATASIQHRMDQDSQ